jgi:hypothetical protein
MRTHESVESECEERGNGLLVDVDAEHGVQERDVEESGEDVEVEEPPEEGESGKEDSS